MTMGKTLEVDDSQLTARQAEFVRAAFDLLDGARAAFREHGTGAIPLLAQLSTDRLTRLAVRLPVEESLQTVIYDAVQTATRIGLGADPDVPLGELAQRLTETFPSASTRRCD